MGTESFGDEVVRRHLVGLPDRVWCTQGRCRVGKPAVAVAARLTERPPAASGQRPAPAASGQRPWLSQPPVTAAAAVPLSYCSEVTGARQALTDAERAVDGLLS